VRDQPALAELASPHDQELPVDVDIVEEQPACLPGSQSESVAQRKDRVIRRTASGGPWVVWKCRGRLEQLAGVGVIEDERQPTICLPSPDPA
jgi:hypothetical protein